MKTKHFISIIALLFVAILISGCVQKSLSTTDFLYPEEKIRGLEKRIQELEEIIERQVDGEKDTKVEEKEEMEIGITQGVYGIVKYGAGDCMPNMGPSNRVFEDYEGDIYFARKNKFTVIPKTDHSVAHIELPLSTIFSEILKNSTKVRVVNGYYEVNLDIGDYVLLFSDYSWNRWNYRFVTVNPKEVTYDSSHYFECLVY